MIADRARTIGLAAVIVVGLTIITTVHAYYLSDVRREEHAALQYTAAILADRLNGRIDAMINTVEGLASFLTAEPSLPGPQAFDHYARDALRRNPVLRALQLVNTNAIIVHQIPVEGNEAAQGLDLKRLADWVFLKEARQLRKTVIGPNPGRLLQGSTGVIVRTPLYRGEAFFGWAQGVYDVESLLHGTERHLHSHVSMQLLNSDGKAFLGSETIPATAVSESIKADGEIWKLRVALGTPWRPFSSAVLVSIWVGGLSFLALVVKGVNRWWGRVEQLNQVVRVQEAQLDQSEKRFQHIFERAPIALWEEDFSAVGEWLSSLRENGIKDLGAYLKSEPQALHYALSLVQLVEVNESTLRLWKIGSKQELLDGWMEMFTDETYDVFAAELLAIWDGRNKVTCVCSAKTATGEPIHYEMHWIAPMVNGQMDLRQVIVGIVDLTDIKNKEDILRKNEKNLQLAGKIAKIGYWERDLRSDEIVWSAGACRILGLEAETSTFQYSEAIFDCIHPEDLNMIRGAVAALQGYEVEYRVLRADNTLRWVHSKAEVDLNEHGQPMRRFGIVQDITDRKRAEEALRESEERYRSLVEDQIELVTRIKPDGTILFVNTGFCNYFGVYREALEGKKWYPTAHPDDLPLIRLQLSGLCSENPIVIIENRVYDANKKIRWVEFSNRAIFNENGAIQEIQTVGRDITDRKWAEMALDRTNRELRDLTARLASSEEDTRKAIAAEIHDDLGQRLTAIGMAMDSALTRLSRGVGDVREPLQNARTELNRITDSTRAIIDGLRPPNLDDYGLSAAIRWHMERFEHTTGIPAKVNVPDLIRHLPADVEIGVFRILQEALNNVTRHAKAASVTINLTEDDSRFRLSIADDGVGYDNDIYSRSPSAGHGLIFMRERALALGGKLTLNSQPRHGTVVQVEIWYNT